MLKVNFCKEEGSSDLNGMFMNMGVRDILECKYYKGVDMILPFVAEIIDQATGFVRDAPIPVVHRKYSELVLKLIKDY